MHYKARIYSDTKARKRYCKKTKGQVRWLTSVIPAIWEAKVGGSQG